MSLSLKQESYVNYLLKRLGFSDNYFLKSFKASLERNAPDFILMRSVLMPGQDELSCSQDDYTIVDLLSDEENLKRFGNYERKKDNSRVISASDLSNFVFCPAAYAISKSFIVSPKISTKRGIDLHEQHRLDSRIKQKKESVKPTTFFEISEEHQVFLDDIESSEIISSGHSDESVKYFSNNEKEFVGQPDYVFRNRNGQNFIVEEKFHSGMKRNFFQNHKVQLAAYVKYLKQFGAKYGYLVYWNYDFDWGSSRYYMFNCSIYKFTIDANSYNFLDKAFDSLQTFRENEVISFNNNLLRPQKCAGCAYVMYCGHKTARFNQVSLPYADKYQSLYAAEY